MKTNFYYSIKISILITIVALVQSANLYAQGWQWARSGSGQSLSVTQAVATDKWGNVYIAGNFVDSFMLFDTIPLNNAGNQNMFLVKYAPSGEILYAHRYGGFFTDGVTAIAVDTSGNVYITGYFSSPHLDFNGIHLFNTSYVYLSFTDNSSDIFITKFDTGGHAVWAKDAGGANNDLATSIAVSQSGYVYIAGSFNSDTAFFGTTYIRRIDSNKNSNDMFVAKYDSLGNALWSARAGGVYNNGIGVFNDGAIALAADDSNVYVAGIFQSPTMNFSGTLLTNSAGSDRTNDLFIAKYNASGTAIWAKEAGGINEDGATSVTLDRAGNIYLTGYFSSPTIQFDGIILSNTSTYSNMFVVKYNPGGVVSWAKSTGANDRVTPQSIAVDSSCNIYLTGYFTSSTASFGGPMVYNTDNTGYADVFLVKYDSSGAARWATGSKGILDDIAYSIATDAMNNIYVAGYFKSPTITFGYSVDTNSGDASGYFQNAFLAKFNEATMSVPELRNTMGAIIAYPNPCTDKINLSLNGNDFVSISIFDYLGKKIYNEILNYEKNIQLDIHNYNNGMYFIKMQNSLGQAAQLSFTVCK